MAAKSNYEIEIVITNDGQVKASIAGLTKGLEGLTTVYNLLRESQNKNNAATIGTNKYYKEQIRLAEEVRDRTAKTSQEYLKATKEIDALRLAQQELTKEVIKAQAPREGTLDFYRKEIEFLRKEQAQVATNNKEWKERENQIASVRSKMEELTGTTRMSVKPNQDMISNAGLAGATLTELGRTISDANYGIRGMANNLSQLSTLFITLVAKTEGGFIPALTMLGKQIWGPLGLILGFQVVVQQLEAYSMRQDQAADSSKRASDQVYANAVILQDYVTKLNGVNLSEDERIEITQRLIKEIPVLKEEDFKYGNNLLEVRKIIDDYVLSQASRLEIDKLTADNSEILANKRRAEVISNEKDLNKRAEAARRLLLDAGESTKTLETRVLATGATVFESIEMSNEQVLVKFKEFTQSLNDQTKPILDKINELRSQIKFDEDEAEGNARKVSTIYQDLADELAVIRAEEFEARMIEAAQEFRDTVARIKEEQKEKVITAEEAERDIALARDLRVEKEKQIEKDKAEYFLDLTEKQREKEQRDAELAEREKEKGYKNELDRIDKEALKASNAAKKTALEGIKDKKALQIEFNRIDQENLKTQIATIQASIAAGMIGVEVGMEAIDKFEARLNSLVLAAAPTDTSEADKEKRRKDEEEAKRERARIERETYDLVVSFAQAALDAELSIEEAKTARINNELRKRLDTQKLSAEQREAINAQIAKNEEDLQKKRDKIAEKQFKLQKAVNIVSAISETYRTGVLAYGSQLIIGDPTSPIRAQIAQAVAIAAGLANVAMIAKQQFVPSAIGGGGSTSGSTAPSAPAIQAPDFNVVGQSNVSQLAAVVQGQLDRPVKTYVVASDVSTAQELERKKISTATI
jgi:hypothetical protein